MRERSKQREYLKFREKKKREMEKALTKVSSLKVGGSWISKKAKEELSNITQDINVRSDFLFLNSFSCTSFAL